MEAERLLTDVEAANFLNTATQTLRTWRWRGTGPRWLKIGRLARYRKADLELFIEQSARLPR